MTGNLAFPASAIKRRVASGKELNFNINVSADPALLSGTCDTWGSTCERQPCSLPPASLALQSGPSMQPTAHLDGKEGQGSLS